MLLSEYFESFITNFCLSTRFLFEISKISKDDDKERILEKIDKHCNKLINIGGYENEKFYKVGFIDGINLIIECIGGKAKC